jgi:hypothetical protein
MFSFKNINKGWVTSLAGYLIIFACLFSVLLKGTSWADVAVGLTIGVALLGMPNPPLPGAGGTGAVGVLLLLSLAFGGCATFKKCQDKYGTQSPPTTLALTDTVKVPVTITTKADSLSSAMSLDSLASAPVGDTIQLVSAGGLAQVSIWKSPATTPGGSQMLHTRVKVPPQIIHDTITKVVTLYGQCPPAYTFQPSPNTGFFYRLWGYYRTFSTWAFSALLLVLAIHFGIHRPRLL